jgi:hypothetical protein
MVVSVNIERSYKFVKNKQDKNVKIAEFENIASK